MKTATMAVIALGIAGAGLLLYSMVKAGGGGAQKPAYWDNTYPPFPPSWWLSSYNGQYVLMTDPSGVQPNAWIFPQDVAAYRAGGWVIVP